MRSKVMIRKRVLKLILCALQLALIKPVFALQIQDPSQQQLQQDQLHYDTPSNSEGNSDDLHGLITDTPPDEQAAQTEQAHEQSTTDSNSDSQANTESTAKLQDNIDKHTCSFIHDPCEKCECTGCHEACEYCPNTWFCSVCYKEKETTIIDRETEAIVALGVTAAYVSALYHADAISNCASKIISNLPEAPSVLTKTMDITIRGLGDLTDRLPGIPIFELPGIPSIFTQAMDITIRGLVNLVDRLPQIPSILTEAMDTATKTVSNIGNSIPNLPPNSGEIILCGVAVAVVATTIIYMDKTPICTRKKKNRKTTLSSQIKYP